jgi:hypothetical protein
MSGDTELQALLDGLEAQPGQRDIDEELEELLSGLDAPSQPPKA